MPGTNADSESCPGLLDMGIPCEKQPTSTHSPQRRDCFCDTSCILFEDCCDDHFGACADLYNVSWRRFKDFGLSRRPLPGWDHVNSIEMVLNYQIMCQKFGDSYLNRIRPMKSEEAKLIITVLFRPTWTHQNFDT